MLPVLVIVYDIGSAGPMEIARAAAGICEPVYAVDLGYRHCADILPVLQRSAAVCDITGLPAAAAADRLREFRPAGITTFCEFLIARTARIGRSLGLAAHSPETTAALTDKLMQRAAFARAGLPVPAHAEVTGTADLAVAVAAVGLPAVVKPRHGAGSVDTFLLREPADIRAIPHVGDVPMLVERLLPGDPQATGPEWGDYVSVESVVCRGVTQHVGLVGKFRLAEPLRETGILHPCTLPPSTQHTVIAAADAALAAIAATDGRFQIEIKLTAAGPRVIEVNGRMGGFSSDVIQRSSGAWLLRAALQAAAGLDPVVEQPDSRAGCGGSPSSVAFTYFVQPPPNAARVATIGTAAMAQRVPGIRQVLIRAAVGDTVSARAGTMGMVALLSGAAAKHGDIPAIVTAAVDALGLSYSGPQLYGPR